MQTSPFQKNAALAGMLIVLCAFPGCATTPKTPAYRLTGALSGITGRAIESTQSINREKTYRIFFALSQPENCIRLKVISRRAVNENIYVEQPIFVYFIIERAVDIRHFGLKKEPFVFSEIGRNYDSNWNRRGDIEICSDAEDPIRKLAPGVYRIRFSVLEDTAVNFTFTVFTNNGDVAFPNALPESLK